MSIESRRLAIAQLMVTQLGLTWTGLSTSERDAFMDAANGAVQAVNNDARLSNTVLQDAADVRVLATRFGIPPSDSHIFINRLKILRSIDGHELSGMSPEQVTAFIGDPIRFLMRANDETAAIIWRAIQAREPRAVFGIPAVVHSTMAGEA